MKKITYALALILLFSTNVYSDIKHKQQIHQYIVVNAYLLLEDKYLEAGGNINDLLVFRNNIFDPNGNINYDRNHPGERLLFGAWQEDETDAIYGYHLLHPPAFTASITHFWNADLGENHRYTMALESDIPNAWMKARRYLFSSEGNHKFNLGGYNIYSAGPIIDFYKTGNCFIYGNINQQLFDPMIPTTIYIGDAIARAMEMLGRIAHLLADMSVPAHCHVDPHAWPNNDTYEDWAGNNLENQFGYFNDRSNKISGDDGFMPYITCFEDYEAMYYLFYTMNQLSQHFPSDGPIFGAYAEGNNDLPLRTTELLAQNFVAWGNPPTSINVNDIAEKTFNFCVGATASLFYWFGIRTGILKTEINTLEYDYEINNPTFTIKSTNSIILKPGFKFTATSPNGELKASIIDCGSQPEQIP